MSITVVPKKKATPGSSSNARSKENEAVVEQKTPMVIEVDPVALQKARATVAPQQHPTGAAKARKSFPTSKSSSARPASGQSQPKSGGSAAQRSSAGPPMVSIPSRHLGIGGGSTTASETGRTQHQPSTARIPSITVRPVAQSVTSQQSIIMQSGNSETSASITPAKQSGSVAGAVGGNGTLALNTMHTVGSDSTFGTGGLVLTFNRPAAGTNASSKSESGSLTAQLTNRTQQIAEMVKHSLIELVDLELLM